MLDHLPLMGLAQHYAQSPESLLRVGLSTAHPLSSLLACAAVDDRPLEGNGVGQLRVDLVDRGIRKVGKGQQPPAVAVEPLRVALESAGVICPGEEALAEVQQGRNGPIPPR